MTIGLCCIFWRLLWPKAPLFFHENELKSAISSPRILSDLWVNPRCKRDLSKVKDEVNSLTVWVPSELPDLLRALVEGSKHEDGRLCIDLYVKRSISGKTM